MVGGVDACRVVDCIGIYASAAECVFDSGSLGKAKIAAFDHHPYAQLGGRHAAQIVGVVADLFVSFITRTHVSTDAAVVQHVSGGPQNGAYQTLAVKGVTVASERGTCLGTQLDALLAAAPDPAPPTDKRGIVVGPL